MPQRGVGNVTIAKHREKVGGILTLRADLAMLPYLKVGGAEGWARADSLSLEIVKGIAEQVGPVDFLRRLVVDLEYIGLLVIGERPGCFDRPSVLINRQAQPDLVRERGTFIEHIAS